MMLKTNLRCATAALLGAACLCLASAASAQKITFLLPSAAVLPAFAPFMLAQHKGYYKAEGLEVEFETGKGGADVAKQVGAGNATMGVAIGDSVPIVRSNGVPVKAVALLGGRSLMQLVSREDRNINSPKDLKDKTVSVMAFQDMSFYALLATLASANLNKNSLQAQAVGPVNVWQLLVRGDVDAMVGVPEWGMSAEAAGAKLKWTSTNAYYPGMAQVIIASDTTIKTQPQVVQKFVSATLKALKELIDDPQKAGLAYIEAVPAHKGKEDYIMKTLRYYATTVYPGQAKLGAIDAARLDELQTFFVAQSLIPKKLPADEVFTNQFLPR